jgi:hypothetical protein
MAAPGATTISFIDRTNDRALPATFTGEIYVWDIDKTYLDTRFSSVRGLLGIPFELAIDKRALPGTVPLLRALRHGPGEESALQPIYFISGSPKELRRTVERKMTLDAVQFDGITFKDQVGLLKARRPRGIVEQVGYKLKALLLYRREHPPGARYMLFGDDVERDLESFLLFGEVCAGLRGASLRGRLAKMGVHATDVEEAASIADALPVTADPVTGIFIHEVRGGRLRSADPRVRTAASYLAHARVLLELGKIRARDVEAVRVDIEGRA